jgi:hypothetical protein
MSLSLPPEKKSIYNKERGKQTTKKRKQSVKSRAEYDVGSKSKPCY